MADPDDRSANQQFKTIVGPATTVRERESDREREGRDEPHTKPLCFNAFQRKQNKVNLKKLNLGQKPNIRLTVNIELFWELLI